MDPTQREGVLSSLVLLTLDQDWGEGVLVDMMGHLQELLEMLQEGNSVVTNRYKPAYIFHVALFRERSLIYLRA